MKKPIRQKLTFPLPPNHPLVKFANEISAQYQGPVYLVGSQLVSDNPRDVDIVCVVTDDDFSFRFGDAMTWIEEGKTGAWTEIRWEWSRTCSKIWRQAVWETGFAVDFKIIPQSFHNFFADKNLVIPPVRLDTCPDY